MQAVFLDWNSIDKNDLDSKLLTSTADWEFYDYTSVDEVCERTKNAEVIVSNKVKLDKSVLEKAQNLKLICIAATGTNNVDLEVAKSRDIRVCNVRAYGTSSVVQHVFTLVLMLMRNIPQYQAAVKRGDWQKSSGFSVLDYPIVELNRKNLGIIGYGELGQAVAKIAQVFGMNVMIASHPDKGNEAGRMPLNKLLAEVDVLTLHCPLTEKTKNLIAKAEFEQMKSSAYLINVARGAIVDEQALKAALESHQIAGAGLDVLAQEPPEKSSPLLQMAIPNLIITPHIAWAGRNARQNVLNQVAYNIKHFYTGPARNIVV